MLPEQTTDEKFMRRALDLAVLGLGSVSPNPMVGCLIVHNGKIIGEGWHKKFGGPHAEVNAIESVAERNLLKDSTLYVTLEPCSHHGKTPPCADLLIANQIQRVVVANIDPNPIVRGNGIAKLKAAGADVTTGVLESEARVLNRRFFLFMEHKRPYIILKWAQTADGFIARANHDSKWISNEYSRMLVHRWRSEEDAVIVGSQTAAYDDPQLNVRDWTGRDPVRVVIDRNLKLSRGLKIFNGAAKTLCYNVLKNEVSKNVEFIKIGEERFIADLVNDLYSRNIQSVIVEGGAQILNAFITLNFWDEARVFYSPMVFENGIKAPEIHADDFFEDRLSSDTLKIYYRARS
jgi:diaminohydroxyphosphoribosylaminopyrimidine deaminase / 5-amino-6-(5-phosphoribosylamino)uracil reductase